jgi:hypothetical protein
MEAQTLTFENELYKDLGYRSEIRQHLDLLFQDLAELMGDSLMPCYSFDSNGLKHTDPKGSFTMTNYHHVFSINNLSTLSVKMEEKTWRNNTRYYVKIQFIIDFKEPLKTTVINAVSMLCEELHKEMDEINEEYEYEKNLAEYKDRQSDYYM